MEFVLLGVVLFSIGHYVGRFHPIGGPAVRAIDEIQYGVRHEDGRVVAYGETWVAISRKDRDGGTVVSRPMHFGKWEEV